MPLPPRSWLGSDPPFDTMLDRIEKQVRTLLVAFDDPAWAPSTSYALGDIVRGVKGRHAVVTVAGTSGLSEPRWPTDRGLTVTDSGATWTDAGISLQAVPVFYRGVPGVVPVAFYPFGEIWVSEAEDTNGQDGYTQTTGMVFLRYRAYVAFEVIHRDAVGLAPDSSRSADVPSYLDSKELAMSAFGVLTGFEWKGGLASYDTNEATVELRPGRIRTALAQRPNNVTNRGEFEFGVYTARFLGENER